MNGHPKYGISLTRSNLFSKSVKRTDVLALKFAANWKQFSKKHLQRLAMVIKSCRKIRKIDIDCFECQGLTDEGLKVLSDSFKMLNYVKSIDLRFDK